MKNKLLFTAILFVIATNTFSQVPNYVPTNGLVGWWPFNGNAVDESINTNDGIVNGATLTTDRFGMANKAYSFDGINDIITILNSPNFILYRDDFTNNNTQNDSIFTASVWVQSIGNNIQSIFSKREYTDFSLSLNNNGFVDTYISHPSNECNPIGTNDLRGSWVHIIVVCNLPIISTYVNGQLVNTCANNNISTLANPSNFEIGYWDSNEPLASFFRPFDGKIDDIGIWNRALTQCEIQDLYATQLNSTFVSAGLDQTICNGEQVTLTAANSQNYSWNNSVLDGVSFAPTSTQDYTVLADSAGCLSSDIVTVTVNQPTNSSETVSNCGNFTWSANGQTYAQSGTYTSTFTNAVGCLSTQTLLLTIKQASSSTLTETALDSYTLNNQTYTQSGTYTQVIPNAAGCDSTITLNLNLNFTGITELKDGIRIYPNPTFDNLTIERTSSLNSNYVLVDSQGRLVLQGELTETITHLSLGKLEYGNYILQLENQSVPIRIVKQ